LTKILTDEGLQGSEHNISMENIVKRTLRDGIIKAKIKLSNPILT
jgi:hypothetical protein